LNPRGLRETDIADPYGVALPRETPPTIESTTESTVPPQKKNWLKSSMRLLPLILAIGSDIFAKSRGQVKAPYGGYVPPKRKSATAQVLYSMAKSVEEREKAERLAEEIKWERDFKQRIQDFNEWYKKEQLKPKLKEPPTAKEQLQDRIARAQLYIFDKLERGIPLDADEEQIYNELIGVPRERKLTEVDRARLAEILQRIESKKPVETPSGVKSQGGLYVPPMQETYKETPFKPRYDENSGAERIRQLAKERATADESRKEQIDNEIARISNDLGWSKEKIGSVLNVEYIE